MAEHLLTLGGQRVRRWESSSGAGLAQGHDEVFEAAGRGHEQETAALVADPVALGHTARGDEVAGSSHQRRLRAFELEAAVEDPAAEVVVVESTV